MRIKIYGLQTAALLGLRALLPAVGWASGSVVKNCPTRPAQNVSIASVETYSGSRCTISTTGDVDSFQFNGTAEDTWNFVAGLGSNPPVDICIAVYHPETNTTPIYSGCTWHAGAANSVGTAKSLSTGGLYTIVMTETSNGVTPFALSLDRINPLPQEAIALPLNETVSGGIPAPTAQAPYISDEVPWAPTR